MDYYIVDRRRSLYSFLVYPGALVPVTTEDNDI